MHKAVRLALGTAILGLILAGPGSAQGTYQPGLAVPLLAQNPSGIPPMGVDGTAGPILLDQVSQQPGLLKPPVPVGQPQGVWRTYVVQKGDCLSLIAQRYYGSLYLWPLIFQANRDKISNPDLIYPGQVLLLPPLDGFNAGAPPVPAGQMQPFTWRPQPNGVAPDGSLIQTTAAGGITTRSPQFSQWFAEASAVARQSWGMGTVYNKYGRQITEADVLRAILYVESRGVHQNGSGQVTTSSAGALGFMQLMPSTARGLGVDPRDPRQNLLGGARFLATCFSSDAARNPADSLADRIAKAAASYNKGPYDRSLAGMSWQQYVQQSSVSETVRYGIMVKMALGLELSPTEESWMARDRGLSVPSVASLSDSTYVRSQSLA